MGIFVSIFMRKFILIIFFVPIFEVKKKLDYFLFFLEVVSVAIFMKNFLLCLSSFFYLFRDVIFNAIFMGKFILYLSFFLVFFII
jgi:hypothetical protein